MDTTAIPNPIPNVDSQSQESVKARTQESTKARMKESTLSRRPLEGLHPPTILSILALITVLFGLIQFSVWPVRADIARLEKNMVEVKADIARLETDVAELKAGQKLLMDRLDLLLKNQNQTKK